MKQIMLCLVVAMLASGMAQSQPEAIAQFIEQHKKAPAFTFAYLSKDLFEVAAQTRVADKDWNKLHNVVRNIGSLSILAADSITDGIKLYKEALQKVPTDEFDELLTVRDGKENVRIWAKSEESVVTDMVLLVGSPDEFVLVCFAGELELGNLSELAELFEAGAAEQLARTTEAVAIDFGVSPNPSSGAFTIAYNDEQDVPSLLCVIDQHGRQVAQLRLSGIPIQQVILPELPSGLYWVQLKTQGGKVGVKQVRIVKN